MKRKLFLITAFCLSALMITGCSDRGDGTPSEASETSAVQTEKSNSDADALPFSETVGVWYYGGEFVFHSSDGNRYVMKEDSAGTVQSSEGKSYSLQECDYRLYSIMNLEDDKLTVSEGRYFETALNSTDYPDGYKKIVITYEKSDLFDIDALEKTVKGGVASAETTAEIQNETEAESASETEAETSAPETESVAETEQPQSETESETEASASSADADDPENAEYSGIYKKIEDFLETDNYKQKDPGNRSLEVFNYLHNLADSNIEESSITNDTAKNEVSFKCYEKYTIIINNTDGTITVNTEE